MTPSHLPFPVGSDVCVPVLLDTDIGSNVDDLLALLFTLGHNRLDLVGVTTVYGDPTLRARVAQATVALVGRYDIPVGYGIGTPHSGKPVSWTGHEGAGYDLSETAEPMAPASSIYAQALAAYGAELVIAAIGPLTNVATALKSADVKPRCVVAMAGQFGSGQPDHNVRSDTVAAAQLMELGVPVVFVGIELCRQVLYDPTDLAAIIEARPDHPLTHVVADRPQAWWDYRGENRSNPCDPLTLLALAQPELFDFQQAEISFVPDGDEAGRTQWEPSDSASSFFATTVNIQRARATILRTLRSCIHAAPAI